MKIPLPVNDTAGKVVFWMLIIWSASPFAIPPAALISGFLLALLIGNPYQKQGSKVTGFLLKSSVVGLGFGMNAAAAMDAGKDGLIFSVSTIVLTLLIGFAVGKWLKISRKTEHLISAGTAICGGSAIAAVAPAIKADEEDISVSLGIIFMLNSAALIIFPPVGKLLGLTQYQFGLWSAVAIHDTSSVVGAAGTYGSEALMIATTVKLVRALWIIPVALFSAWLFRSKESKIQYPWFIGLFIIAMLINSYLPGIEKISHFIVLSAKSGLTVTLFLIGAGLTPEKMKSVGLKPLILGVLLWLVISLLSLSIVINL